MDVGKSGQFDVIVDGETIASRGGNMLTRLFGAGWPDPEDVLPTLPTLCRKSRQGVAYCASLLFEPLKA